MNNVPMFVCCCFQLLVVLGVVCYRKATALKRAVVQKQHEQDADHSDSTVYYQDMIMCSEDSETDDGNANNNWAFCLIEIAE